jgi:hypothetical protein
MGAEAWLRSPQVPAPEPADPCASAPCQNGASCLLGAARAATYTCRCAEGWEVRR